MSATEPTVKPLRTIDAIGLGACLALTVALFVAGAQPILAQRKAQQAQRAQLAAKRQQVAALTDMLNRMRQELNQTQQSVADRALRLAPLASLNRRVSELTELASSCGLQVEQMRPGQPAAGTHYHTVPIDVSGRGSFPASAAFLHQLHATLPDMGVASFKLQGRPGRDGREALPRFQFELRWYAAPPTRNATTSAAVPVP